MTVRTWASWGAVNVAVGGALSWVMFSGGSEYETVFLPGETTHGHYQIEMSCAECHTPNMGVEQDACVRCHDDELKAGKDTHPPGKFNDPAYAHLTERLDATKCVTCHVEHAPGRTHPMGVTVPEDYCFRCHEDIGEDRPSHAGLGFQTCATSGCHNFHDNTALYEKFLADHHGEPELLADPLVPPRNLAERWKAGRGKRRSALKSDRHDAPSGSQPDSDLLSEWAASSHAKAGVNCTHCHASGPEGEPQAWSDSLTHDGCRSCHSSEVEGFLTGRHGMRLDVGLSPMTPGEARLPMKEAAHHKQLNCASCHSGHEFNTAAAAVESCLSCHDDRHSRSFEGTPHHQLWVKEQSGNAAKGSGVSCATCHLPREVHGGVVKVQHNQNWNLRPNENMVRDVCMKCHGLGFTLNSLADPELIRNNFSGKPGVNVESPKMAKDWFDSRKRRRK